MLTGTSGIKSNKSKYNLMVLKYLSRTGLMHLCIQNFEISYFLDANNKDETADDTFKGVRALRGNFGPL